MRTVLGPRRSSSLPERASGRALVPDRAFAALRPDRSAQVLPVLDEQGVERDPVASIEDALERRFGLLGGLRADGPEPVRDPVDVRVDRDRGDPVAEDEHAVRGLGPDRGQAHELRVRPRNDAAEAAQQFARAGPDRARLGMIETGGPDERFDRRRARRGERGGVRVPGEEGRARPVGVGVAGPLREDRSDQHLERVLRMVPQVRRPPVPGAVQRPEPVEDDLPVDRRCGGGFHADRPARAETAVVPGSERSGSSAPSPADRFSSPIR